jgi:hypothetical protein
MIKPKFYKKIGKNFEELLKKEISRLGEETLLKAKEFIPEASGALREAGTISHLTRGKNKIGWTILFDSPYADIVDTGTDRRDIERDYTMTVKTHRRRLASGKSVRVRKHTKQYHNSQRPWHMGDDNWRVITLEGKPGVHFIEFAWTSVRNSVKDKQLRKMLPVLLDRKNKSD